MKYVFLLVLLVVAFVGYNKVQEHTRTKEREACVSRAAEDNQSKLGIYTDEAVYDKMQIDIERCAIRYQ